MSVSHLKGYHEKLVVVNFYGYELMLPLWQKPNFPHDFAMLPCPVLDPSTIQPLWDPTSERYLMSLDLQLRLSEFLDTIEDQISKKRKIPTKIHVIPAHFVKFSLNERFRDTEIDPWLEYREGWIPVSLKQPVCTVELFCPTKQASVALADRIRNDPQTFANRWKMEFAVATMKYDAEPSEVRIEGEDLLNTKLYRAIKLVKIEDRGQLLMQHRDLEIWAHQCSQRIAIRVMRNQRLLVDFQERDDIRKRVLSVLTTRYIDYPDSFNGDWSMVYWGKKYLRPDCLRHFLNSRVSTVTYASGIALYYRVLPRVKEMSPEGRILSEIRFLSGSNAQYEGSNIVFTENQIMKWLHSVGSPVYYSRNFRTFCIDVFKLYQIDLEHLSRIVIAPRWTRRQRIIFPDAAPVIAMPPMPAQTEFSRRGSMQNLNILKEDHTVQTVQVLSTPRPAVVIRHHLFDIPTKENAWCPPPLMSSSPILAQFAEKSKPPKVSLPGADQRETAIQQKYPSQMVLLPPVQYSGVRQSPPIAEKFEKKSVVQQKPVVLVHEPIFEDFDMYRAGPRGEPPPVYNGKTEKDVTLSESHHTTGGGLQISKGPRVEPPRVGSVSTWDKAENINSSKVFGQAAERETFQALEKVSKKRRDEEKFSRKPIRSQRKQSSSAGNKMLENEERVSRKTQNKTEPGTGKDFRQQRSPERLWTQPYRHTSAQTDPEYLKVSKRPLFDPQPEKVNWMEEPLLRVSTHVRSLTTGPSKVQTYISYGPSPEPETPPDPKHRIQQEPSPAAVDTPRKNRIPRVHYGHDDANVLPRNQRQRSKSSNGW